MPSQVLFRDTLIVGSPSVFDSPSPSTQFVVVFEDDGETGYFYGLNRANTQQPILDALHIYNVTNIVDKDKPSVLEIVWSDDGLKACLVINNYPHAVFDFESKRAYCRNDFPPPDSSVTNSHQWDDRALELFK